MIAADSPPMVPRSGFLEAPSFDVVVFGSGADEQRFSFDEFRALPLRQRVHLLLSKPPRFFLAELEIPRAQAMRFHG
jgi:hypothetical protein